jgi:hypothetical protein
MAKKKSEKKAPARKAAYAKAGKRRRPVIKSEATVGQKKTKAVFVCFCKDCKNRRADATCCVTGDHTRRKSTCENAVSAA